MNDKAEPLLNAEEVARLLNLKVPTVYDAVAKGRLPAVRLWRGERRSVIRFRAADIQRIIRERSTSASEKKTAGHRS
jgi:excisionase family DNA binding protein